jgi:uncharacterized protein
VRAYRVSLAAPARATFGFDLLDDRASSVELIEDSFPHSVVERSEGRVEVTSVAPAGRRGAVQLLRLRARPTLVRVSWGGSVRLARAEYTQLTPGGALPPARTENVTGIEGRVLWIDDRALNAAAAIARSESGAMGGGDDDVVALGIALAEDRDSAVAEALSLADQAEALVSAEVASRRRLWTGSSIGNVHEAAVVRRAVAYAIDCAACASQDAVAILADHRILPLVWTRDAYYVCRALLALPGAHSSIASVVADFIRWMFERAERVDGWWPRASLASGQAKDPVFQLDQQLYPLLLVLDHARLTGDSSPRDRYTTICAETLEALLAKRARFGLIASGESPADDPISQPYHFSSHVLLWRVLEALEHGEAARVRDDALRHFTSEGRFAYAIGGPDAEGARHYYDANDFPTVFAPGWGFCTAEDARWRATMDFAWSDANEGYFRGKLGGLGSLHTPHPWPLGDLQEIVVARLTRDRAREQRARDRLARVETWDGMLPEAYDENSGEVASRHWFAWPAAVRALLEREPMLTAP